MTTAEKKPGAGGLRRRRFATTSAVLALLLASGGVLPGQDELPLRQDDEAYAKKLSDIGKEDLAVAIYERLYVQPGLTPKRKQEIGQQVVAAYQALASKALNLAAREKYLALAERKIESMVKELGERVMTPGFRYQRAQVLQTKGRSIAKAVKEETNAGRKQALIADGARKLDECTAMLEQVAKEAKAQVEALRKKDPFDYQKAAEPHRMVAIKADLQRAWTSYYKALLYDSDHADYKSNLGKAVQLFGAFIDEYPTDMSILIARYGRGLSHELLRKLEEAREDFGKVVELIEEAGAIPEVQPLKARCTIKWAEVSIELGKLDEALAGVEKMLKENPALESDVTLAEYALVTKARTLAAKGGKLKADGNAADAAEFYKQAITELRKVVQKEGAYSFEASQLIAKYVAESGVTRLDPEVRLALSQALLREKKYSQAIRELRKIIEGLGTGVTPQTAFRARRLLAVALRYDRQYEDSTQVFEAIFRMHQDQPAEELAKVMLEYSWTLGRFARANPGNRERDKVYIESLRRLADEYPNTKEGINARYFYAEALRDRAGTADKFEEAATVYAKVREASKYYGRARYLEGLCHYNVYKVHSAKKDADNPKAQTALKTAREKLIGVIEDLPSPRSGENWHVEAARALADIYMDLKQPKEALAILDMVAKKYPELAVGNPKMLAIRLKIYVQTGKLEEAVAVVDELAGKGGTDPEVLLRGYLMLGDAYQKNGDQLVKDGKLEEGDRFHKSAAGFLVKAFPYIAKDDDRVYNWLATRAYLLKDYETCAKAIDAVEKTYLDSGQEADRALWRLRILKAKCFEAMAHWPPEALTLLKKLEERYPKVVSIKELRAGVLESKREWQEALLIWDEVDEGVKPGTPEWFNAKYHRALCNYKLGDRARGNEIISGLRALNPEMGGPEMKRKFEELYRQHNP